MFVNQRAESTVNMHDISCMRVDKLHVSIGNPIVEIRRSYDRFISTMGFLYW